MWFNTYQTSSSNPFKLIDQEISDDLDEIIVDNDVNLSDTIEEGTDEEDEIGLSDLESNSEESTKEAYDGSDLADFIDNRDAPSSDTDDEDDDDDFWFSKHHIRRWSIFSK